MKIIRSLLSATISLVIIILNIVPAFAFETAYDSLLQYGYSQNFLDSMSNEIIERMANQIGNDEEITNIYVKTVYLNENNGMQTYGMISEDSLALDISVAEICKKETNIITRVLVSISWDWAGTRPLQRFQDGITVNWDANLFAFYQDSFLAQDYGKSDEDEEWEVEGEYKRPAHHAQGGLGFYSQMSTTKKRTAGAAIFLLEPKISIVSGSSEVTEINVNYVHDRSFLIPLNIGFNTIGLNVGFSINGNSYDEAADSVNFRYNLGG